MKGISALTGRGLREILSFRAMEKPNEKAAIYKLGRGLLPELTMLEP